MSTAVLTSCGSQHGSIWREGQPLHGSFCYLHRTWRVCDSQNQSLTQLCAPALTCRAAGLLDGNQELNHSMGRMLNCMCAKRHGFCAGSSYRLAFDSDALPTMHVIRHAVPDLAFDGNALPPGSAPAQGLPDVQQTMGSACCHKHSWPSHRLLRWLLIPLPGAYLALPLPSSPRAVARQLHEAV